MLIQSLQPPYPVRFNQVQSIFMLAVAEDELASEKLQQLILSDSNLFDILPQFFYHRNAAVCRAALEVRHTYLPNGSLVSVPPGY